MKTLAHPPRLLIPLLPLSLLPFSGLLAQTDSGTNSTNAPTNQTSSSEPNPPPPPGPNGPPRPDFMGLGSLTQAERQQFFADMKQIKDNPQLVTAREAVKQAMQSLDQTRSTLLLQVDPSIQPVLTKIQQARQNHVNHGGSDGPQGPPPPPPSQN